MERAAQWLGTALPIQTAIVTLATERSNQSSESTAINLGAPTAKWDYLDASGALIACVYRFDPAPGKKQFRPWNVSTRKFEGLDPRPLYNQPGMAHAHTVVLVEGEKCAQALIDLGICATTAMHGAKAPIEKTDWSPLLGKSVLIWPDKDRPGWDYACAVADSLAAMGVANVLMLTPPEEKAEGWDAADAIADGFDAAGFIAEREHALASADANPLDGIDWRTEDGLASSFTKGFGPDWRYCPAWGKWLGWSAGRWQEDRRLTVMHLARQLARAASRYGKSERQVTRLASASSIAALERLARNDPKHATVPEAFDADAWLLNTPKGIVDLIGGRLFAHQRDKLMTRMATAAPNAGATAPRWQAFLVDVTGGDEELQAYLQRVVGYCLTGSTREHALFFLYGTGANGKSVFLNVLADLLGDYAINAPMETFMDSGSERHPTELASLRGARFVTAIETEQGRRWNESRIKTLTGGDKITARFMRQDFFDYTPQFKLVIAGNHKPAIRNVDEAMRRRLHLIPFTVTIPPDKRDSQLTEKLLAERAGILAWAVEGCQQWLKEGLKPPALVCEATKEYFNNEDAVQEFEDEALIREAQGQTPIAKVYGAWKAFAERNGYYVGSVRWLTEQMITRGVERSRGTGGVKCLRGIRLKNEEKETYRAYLDD